LAHVAMVSHPDEIVDLIEPALTGIKASRAAR
jgi:hypothetical protein